MATRRLLLSSLIASSLYFVMLLAPASAHATTAYFLMDYPPAPETFVIELTSMPKIKTARSMLTGKSTTLHVMGTIITQPVWYNAPWHYYLDPATIDFFENATETCDASIAYIETNLDSVGSSFLPQNGWCPWNSRLLSEITPTPPPTLTGDFNFDGWLDFQDVHQLFTSFDTFSPTNLTHTALIDIFDLNTWFSLL